jgi:hypothetical protein
MIGNFMATRAAMLKSSGGGTKISMVVQLGSNSCMRQKNQIPFLTIGMQW